MTILGTNAGVDMKARLDIELAYKVAQRVVWKVYVPSNSALSQEDLIQEGVAYLWTRWADIDAPRDPEAVMCALILNGMLRAIRDARWEKQHKVDGSQYLTGFVMYEDGQSEIDAIAGPDELSHWLVEQELEDRLSVLGSDDRALVRLMMLYDTDADILRATGLTRKVFMRRRDEIARQLGLVRSAPVEVDDAQLVAAFEADEFATYRSVATTFGTNPTRVMKACKAAGVPARGKGYRPREYVNGQKIGSRH